MEYDDTNKGVLFREKEKKSESHPDFKGSINVGGKDYWLSGWVNESKALGKDTLSYLLPRRMGHQSPRLQLRQLTSSMRTFRFDGSY